MPDFAALVPVLEYLEHNPATAIDGEWSLYRTLIHCAQSIEYSITGFPVHRSIILRRTVGPLVARRFLKRGAMNHNRAEPIPGAPEIPEDGPVPEAVRRLREAMARFANHSERVSEHFIFGRLSKEQFGELHVLHMKNHFELLHESAHKPEK